MKYLFLLVAAFGLAACDIKVKGDSAPAPEVPAKPVCARSIVRDVPQAFQMHGTAAGAVRTESCETLVVGTNASGDILLAKYDSEGRPVDGFADHSVSKPLSGRYGALNVRIQRLAVINNGFFALGTYGRDLKSLFVFRFLDSGFLDLGYGPLRDGVARAPVDSRTHLLTVGAPNVEGEQIRLRNRVEDRTVGLEADVDQMILLSGQQALDKDARAVPASCELLNHSAMKDQTTYQLTQNDCANLTFNASGPSGSDALTIPLNGTSVFSNVFGEWRWFYEGRVPVVQMRDTLGYVKKEFATFVQGQTYICGTSVSSARRYLVFSRTPAGGPDWLSNCWFL